MLVDRREGRRRNQRAFRPTLSGGLETRYLLSRLPGAVFLRHPAPGIAYTHNQPPFTSAGAREFNVASFPRGVQAATATAHGGQSVIVGIPDGSHFRISLTQFIPPAGEGQTGNTGGTTSNVPGTQNPIQGQIPGGGPVQPIGTVRAYPMSGGRIGLIVDGSNTQTELDISPVPFPQRKSYAHSFAYGQTKQSHLLNIGQITVNSGSISAILGYHTADLSGPLVIAGTTAVDRIAFQDLLPGASIVTGGDLNTLDVLNGITLSGGAGIRIGRDLNLINVGQNINLSNGASLVVNRFLGTTPQPPKGTATGSNFLSINQSLIGTGTSTTVPSLSGYVQGDVILGTGSSFAVGSGISNSSITDTSAGQQTTSPSVFLVNGTVTLSTIDQLAIPNLVPSNTFNSSSTPNPNPPPAFLPPNFVARNGFVIST